MHRYILGAACWWPMAPKPPVHRRSCVRCTSRRWRLLVYTGQGRTAPRRAHGCRTVLSYDVTAEMMQDWARMMDIEFVHITKDTTVEGLEYELFLNDLAWKLK